MLTPLPPPSEGSMYVSFRVREKAWGERACENSEQVRKVISVEAQRKVGTASGHVHVCACVRTRDTEEEEGGARMGGREKMCILEIEKEKEDVYTCPGVCMAGYAYMGLCGRILLHCSGTELRGLHEHFQ